MNKILLITFSLLFLSPLLAGLTNPPNGSNLTYVHVLFEWDEVAWATDYELQISGSTDFTTPLLNINTTELFYIEKDGIEWESNYYWRVRANDGEWMGPNAFSTVEQSFIFSNDISAVDIVTHNSNFTFDGITIFGVMNPFYSAAIDMNGREIWNSGGIDSYMFLNVDNNYNFLGNANLPPQYKGELGVEFEIIKGIVWNQPTYGDEEDFLQHELIKLPNGNYMGFVVTYKEHFVPNSDDFTQIPDSYDFPFEDNIDGWDGSFVYPWTWKGDKIVEWDNNGNEVWSWDPFDHYNLNDFDYQSSFWEYAAFEGKPFDWTHFNALIYSESENAIYVSSKNLSRITKINKESGEILWNIGKQWLGDEVITPEFKFSGQHGLQLLENGNLVFFDNGILSGKFDGTNVFKSTAIEIQISVIDGVYSAETVWSHTLPTELYGVISGNVQKLSNNNYLITTVGSSDGAHSLEVTPSGETVWDCKYNIGTPQGAIYRAMRIPNLFNSTIEDNLSANFYNLTNSFNINSILPNPFNPTVNIEYEISKFGIISGNIYNLRGELIENLFSTHKSIGQYNLIWDGSFYPSGIYLFSLTNENSTKSQIITLIK